MMNIKASVNLECEAKSVDECQAGKSLFIHVIVRLEV